MEHIQNRTAEIADAENIAHLVNIAFRPERFFIDGERIHADEVRALFQKGKFLLVEDAGTLAACVYVELRGERGYFGLLAVDPARQRTGIGSYLIATVEELCRDAGCRFMDLTIVNLRIHMPGYYRSHGYTENGTLPFPESHNPQPKVPCHLVKMSKPLT